MNNSLPKKNMAPRLFLLLLPIVASLVTVEAFFGLWGNKTPSPPASPPVAPAAAPATPVKDTGARLPALYSGWFDQTLINQASAAINAALKDGIQYSEVLFPPLPNMEELDFGTALNQKYNKEVAARLAGPDNVLRKQSVAYANVDIGNRIAAKLGGKRAVLLAFDGAVNPEIIKLGSKAELKSINSPDVAATTAGKDILMALSPGTSSHWQKAGTLKTEAPVVALNAPFSLNYDIAQGGKWEPIYICKRISKGWIYRAYPNPFKCYIDLPDGSVQLLKIYENGQVPKLRECAAVVREESRKYGLSNDRYITQRL